MKTNKKISFLLAFVMIFTSLITPFSDVLKAEGGGVATLQGHKLLLLAK